MKIVKYLMMTNPMYIY